MRTLYTAHASVTGGRNGHVTSSDGVLDLRLALPREMGGPGGAKTNPEQLFAAGYAACFDSALAHVAAQRKLRLEGTRIAASVGIGPDDKGGFCLSVRLAARIPGVPRAVAEELLQTAHQVCPYSNATRNNVPVEVVLEAEDAAA